MRSVSNSRVCHVRWCDVLLALVLAVGAAGCQPAREPAESPATTRWPPECHIDAPAACRVGCDADEPRRVRDAVPDLSGIDLTGLHGFEIAEILIDARGDVTDACLLRGVREDVDARAVAAMRQWRFEPTRLRHSTPPGQVVSLVMTVSLQIGR